MFECHVNAANPVTVTTELPNAVEQGLQVTLPLVKAAAPPPAVTRWHVVGATGSTTTLRRDPLHRNAWPMLLKIWPLLIAADVGPPNRRKCRSRCQQASENVCAERADGGYGVARESTRNQSGTATPARLPPKVT